MEPAPTPNETVYRCKASLFTPWQLIAIMVGVSMPVMFLTMYIHPFVAVAALLGTMYAVALALTGASVFTLDANGIRREVIPSLTIGKNKKPRIESHRWSDLKWFKEGKDRGRYSPEYRYLTVHFKNGGEWMITDNNGARKADFESFLESFQSYVAEYNRLTAPAVSEGILPESPSAEPAIRQRKTFYETIWAKAFTILVGLFIVVFLFLALTTKYVSATSLFRLFVILIPGFLYMWYRVFREKK